MNQDSITIPISIKLSEIEKGTYPILVEGEIADQKGKTYPIKFAKYANIISEDEWYQGLPKKEKDKIDQDKALQKEISNQTTAEKSKVFNKESNTKSAAKEPEKAHLNPELDSTKIYRIQIMASRTMLSNLDDYKNAHQIKEALFISQADGWFRYNIYASSDLVEAEKLLTQVRNQHQIKDAFIVLYEHGVRKSIASHTKPKGTYTNNQTSNLHSATANNTPKAISSETFYRIEIAMAYEKPIPLYLLQSKVANEEITEFNIDSKFYYTIGKFEEANVAKAYLNYVVNQFKLENAQIVQYKGNTRLRAIQ
ncbi:MAG: hypothetical protein JW729_05270, partial [Bacteroidales bacterium]|nr:hypothetical protein [Bacteroidales bacterium]